MEGTRLKEYMFFCPSRQTTRHLNAFAWKKDQDQIKTIALRHVSATTTPEAEEKDVMGSKN
jgi:hypothetical protein